MNLAGRILISPGGQYVPPVAPPEIAAPINLVAPSLSGTATAGQQITVNVGTWSGDPFGYDIQFYRDGVAIPGAVNTSQILLASEDVGALITATVTANGLGGSTMATTAAIGPIAAAAIDPPVNTVAPVVSGDATVGSVLTVTNGTWTGSPYSFSYQWLLGGFELASETNSTYTILASDVGQDITCQVIALNDGGFTPAVSNAITATGSASRQYGVTYPSAAAGPEYDPDTDIPVDAVDYLTGNGGGAFASVSAWLAYCITNDVPAKINTDVSVTTASHKCPKGIYGYLGTGTGVGGYPKITNAYAGGPANTNPAFLYIWKDEPVLRGLEFYGFGDVLDGCYGSVDRGGGYFAYQGGKTNYGFRRCMPPDQFYMSGSTQVFGVGVQIDTTTWPLVLGNDGPGFDIEACTFTNCQQAVFIVSDTLAPNNWRFVRNTVRGQAGFAYGLAGGGVSIECTTFGDFEFVKNAWGPYTTALGCPLAAKIGSGVSDPNGSRFHTFLKVGVDSQVDIAVRTQDFLVECNEAVNIEDYYFKDTVNAAAMFDIRTNNPTTVTAGTAYTGSCEARVRRNLAQNVLGMVGQEDAQALYTKTLGMCIEYNWWENTGAARFSSGTGTAAQDGPESQGSLHKPAGSSFSVATANSALWERYNVYKGLPANSYATSNMFAAKIADFKIPYYHAGNEYQGCDYSSSASSSGLVRRTDDGNSGTPDAQWTHQWIDNTFFDCVVSDLRLFRVHENKSAQNAYMTISGNKMVWSDRQDFSANRAMISVQNSVGTITKADNILIGSENTYTMDANTASATAPLGYQEAPSPTSLD